MTPRASASGRYLANGLAWSNLRMLGIREPRTGAFRPSGEEG